MPFKLHKQPLNCFSRACLDSFQRRGTNMCFYIDISGLEASKYEPLPLNPWISFDLRARIFAFLMSGKRENEYRIPEFLDIVFKTIGHLPPINIILFVVMYKLRSKNFRYIGTNAPLLHQDVNFFHDNMRDEFFDFRINVVNCCQWWERRHYKFDSLYTVFNECANDCLRNFLRFSVNSGRDLTNFATVLKNSLISAFRFFGDDSGRDYFESVNIGR